MDLRLIILYSYDINLPHQVHTWRVKKKNVKREGKKDTLVPKAFFYYF